MQPRPEYYSGRGAIETDLHDQRLETIYQEIKKGYGEQPAQQFVQMVGDIPKLSATDFLLNLYGLESNHWIWNKELLGDEKGIYAGDYERSPGNLFGTIASVYGGLSVRDETPLIRDQFLRRHGISYSK